MSSYFFLDDRPDGSTSKLNASFLLRRYTGCRRARAALVALLQRQHSFFFFEAEIWRPRLHRHHWRATKRGRLHYHSSAKLESRHFLVICIHEFLCLGTLSIAELQLLFFSVLSVVVVLLVVVLKIIISYIESKSSL